IQLSTGGAVTDGFGPRLAVLDAGLDACSLTCGTVNFGDEVFTNPWPFIRELYARTRELGVVPEFELFDIGHVATLHRLLDDLGEPHGGHVHCDLVMGVPGGMPGNAATLVQAMAALPAGATWSATGIGSRSLPVILAALAAGGHLRVGMEDTVTFARGRAGTGHGGGGPVIGENPVVAEIVRPGFAESAHRGTIAALNADGSAALTAGSATAPVFPRSSNKPIQAAAMLSCGLDLDGKLLALAAASHSGEDFHVAGVREILSRAGLDPGALQCPPDLPLGEPARWALLRRGGGPD